MPGLDRCPVTLAVADAPGANSRDGQRINRRVTKRRMSQNDGPPDAQLITIAEIGGKQSVFFLPGDEIHSPPSPQNRVKARNAELLLPRRSEWSDRQRIETQYHEIGGGIVRIQGNHDVLVRKIGSPDHKQLITARLEASHQVFGLGVRRNKIPVLLECN